MPVVECSCGMIMSVAADESRNACIRCGGMQFVAFDERLQLANPKLADDSSGWLRMAFKRAKPALQTSNGEPARSEFIRDGSHI